MVQILCENWLCENWLRICVRFASTFNIVCVAVLTYDLVICKDSNDCLSYSERLTSLNLYSVQRRRERYIIIYVWKMLESKVLNLNPPTISLWNERRGRICVESHVASGHLAFRVTLL